MNESDGVSTTATQQDRPTVAAIPAWLSLRTRVAVFAALALAIVIGVTTYFQSRLFERTVEAELLEEARLTALAVADDLELRGAPFETAALERHLHEFIESAPELRSISVLTLVSGQPEIMASTSTTVRTDAVDVGRRAIERRDLVWGPLSDTLRSLAVPLLRDGSIIGAVSVTVSMAAVDRLRKTGRTMAAWSTIGAIAVLFLLMEVLARWFIHRPIYAIRSTMREAAAGRLSARSPVLRHDELGAVASGLNDMLAQLQGLHGSLQQRVTHATEELRGRNRELMNMYQQMFRLREELGRAQQLAAVGETASVVAHQIGTPLNLISGHIQLLIEEQGIASPVARRLLVAEEQIRKVTAIVRGLLDRSRHRAVREPVDVAALVGRMCALVQPALDTARVQLVIETTAVPTVDAEVPQLELALLNLISNALDAMPAGGTLTVTVKSAPGAVHIAVADTGTGIAPDIIERIFDPWVTTKPEGRGTGLGLSITRNVIAEHNGTVRVSSRPGAGSVFTVELPARADAGQEHASHAERPDR